ncbi:MAG: hypothetical protein KGY99_02200 [Phycisphaerae bacterium]|nr:hypothetical protein [Phycisphaerae bacterium]
MEAAHAKRELTEGDEYLLGRVQWPDAPREKGRTPDYATETWGPPKRLMVWKTPGRSGMLTAADHWLIVEAGGKVTPDADSVEDGKLKDSWWHADTDIVVPAASEKYHCRRAGKFPCRHITVGHKAKFEAAALTSLNGNVWVARGGYYRTRYSTRLKGGKHTFFLNDQPRLTPESIGEDVEVVGRGYIIPQEHPGPGYDGYCVAQYLRVRKADDASVEFVGTLSSSDDFQLLKGTAIVAENSQLWAGTRSKQHFRPGTTLRLMSGGEYGKAHTAPGSGYGFKYSQGSMDAVINGRIEAGTEDHPITENAYFGISFKAPAGFEGSTDPSDGTLERRVPGAIVGPDTEIAVHTADADEAKLVIRWHRRHNDWYEGRLDGYKQMPEEITIGICGKLMLENVKFDDLARDGLMLEDPAVAEHWKNVTFGDRCQGGRDELIAEWSETLRKPIVPDDWDCK